jgi:plasmid maintenance system antidote protein VapI
MNDERDYWSSYVERTGGIAAVAERLETPYPTIAGICNGSRGIGRKLAIRFAAKDPMLDASRLVWVQGKAKSEQVRP